jgi:hypothetical protein
MESYGDRLHGACCLNREIRSRTQTADTGKYSFINRTIQLSNELPAEVLATFLLKPHIYRNRVRKVFTNKENFTG